MAIIGFAQLLAGAQAPRCRWGDTGVGARQRAADLLGMGGAADIVLGCGGRCDREQDGGKAEADDRMRTHDDFLP